MNNLQIFANEQFGEVRTVSVDNEPWFLGKDVCVMFGDKNHNRSLARVDDVDRRSFDIEDSMGRTQRATFVNESGLYGLLFAMQPQKANNDGVSDAYPIEVQERIEKLREFKRWITHEVIPSIRKHGAYMTEQTLEDALTSPDFLIRLATQLKEEQEARKALEAENAAMQPKALFADAVTASHTSILIGELAKILKQNGIDIGQNKLFERLRQDGYLMKTGSSKNMPTQSAMEKGLFEIKESTKTEPNGSVRIMRTTKVTGKGQMYFVNLFLNKASDNATA